MQPSILFSISLHNSNISMVKSDTATYQGIETEVDLTSMKLSDLIRMVSGHSSPDAEISFRVSISEPVWPSDEPWGDESAFWSIAFHSAYIAFNRQELIEFGAECNQLVKDRVMEKVREAMSQVDPRIHNAELMVDEMDDSLDMNLLLGEYARVSPRTCIG